MQVRGLYVRPSVLPSNSCGESPFGWLCRGFPVFLHCGQDEEAAHEGPGRARQTGEVGVSMPLVATLPSRPRAQASPHG